VGRDSIAYINGGTVQTTGTGTTAYAISTATTNPSLVPNAKIIMTGGRVSVTAANAINLTGQNSGAAISGGWVSSTTGNAIHADSTASNANITVSGGQVTATTGFAVKTPNTVSVSNGFVFAYGAGIGNVVTAAKSSFPTNFPTGNGIVAAWNKPASTPNPIYIENTRSDLTMLPANSVKWVKNTPPQNPWDGIYYERNNNAGFFMLDGVTVHSPGVEWNGLIFDIVEGKFYVGEVLQAKELSVLYPEYAPGPAGKWEWNAVTQTLALRNFNWITEANGAPALSIINGASITLELVGENTFVSTGTGANASGIISAANITIAQGTGAITAASSNSEAINDKIAVLPGGYAYWTGTNPDGSNAAFGEFPSGTAAYSYANKYVRIQARETHALTINNGTSSSMAVGHFAGEVVTITAAIPPTAPATL
jgi:hypothetical protein